MEESRYIISDASKQVGVEAHVLRYWEEELSLPIPRNEMGHRYYTEDNIRQLKQVKEMKDKGFQLKAIRMALNNQLEHADEVLKGDTERHVQAKQLVKGLLLQILSENNQILLNSMREEVVYLFREQEEREEARFKRFDELLREKQKHRFRFGIKKQDFH